MCIILSPYTTVALAFSLSMSTAVHIFTLHACARGKAIPSVHRLSVCLSSAKKSSNILQADTSSTYKCHKLCKQSYLNIHVPHNTEHVAILCTLTSYYPCSAPGHPSWDTVYWIIYRLHTRSLLASRLASCQ